MTTFFWYPDGSKNPWQSWYGSQDSAVRGRHDHVVRFLDAGHWKEPYSAVLKNTGGLVEIRIVSGVQHRLIGIRHSITDEFTVMIACTHKQKRYNPTDAIETAMSRAKEVKEGSVVTIHCSRPTHRPPATAAPQLTTERRNSRRGRGRK